MRSMPLCLRSIQFWIYLFDNLYEAVSLLIVQTLEWKLDGHNNSKGNKLWADTLSVETELVISGIESPAN